MHVLKGRDKVVRRAVRQGPRFANVCQIAVVNGAAGIVVRPPTGQIAVAGLTVVNGQIVTIDLLTDPSRLRFATVG